MPRSATAHRPDPMPPAILLHAPWMAYKALMGGTDEVEAWAPFTAEVTERLTQDDDHPILTEEMFTKIFAQQFGGLTEVAGALARVYLAKFHSGRELRDNFWKFYHASRTLMEKEGIDWQDLIHESRWRHHVQREFLPWDEYISSYVAGLRFCAYTALIAQYAEAVMEPHKYGQDIGSFFQHLPLLLEPFAPLTEASPQDMNLNILPEYARPVAVEEFKQVAASLAASMRASIIPKIQAIWGDETVIRFADRLEIDAMVAIMLEEVLPPEEPTDNAEE